MDSRQRVVTAICHQTPDLVPVDLSWGLTPTLLTRIKAIMGADSPDDYFGLDVRFVPAEVVKGWGKTPGVDDKHHFDILPIVPALIEIGVDILFPVQPKYMDPVFIKQRFGDQLAFWGSIGTQTTFPFGTLRDVKEKVRRQIETVGIGSGLLIGPTHALEPDLPWENSLAFFEALN